MKNHHHLVIYVIAFVCFFAKSAYPQKRKLDNNFEGACYVFTGVGLGSSNLKNYNDWLSTKKLPVGEGNYLPIHAGFMAISRKKIMYGLYFSATNKTKLNPDILIPHSAITVLGKVGYNFLTVNRLNFYFMTGIGYQRTDIDWKGTPPSDFYRPYITSSFATNRQDMLVLSPEFGINYIVPIDVDEGLLLGLTVGTNVSVISGDWKYSDYKSPETYTKYSPRPILLTPEIPKSLKQVFYVNFSIGYFISW